VEQHEPTLLAPPVDHEGAFGGQALLAGHRARVLVARERDDDSPVVVEHPPRQRVRDRAQLAVDPLTDIRLQLPRLGVGRWIGGPQLGRIHGHCFALPKQRRDAPTPRPMFLNGQHFPEQVLLKLVVILGAPTLPQRGDQPRLVGGLPHTAPRLSRHDNESHFCSSNSWI